MTENQETWQAITIIATARVYEPQVREIIFSLGNMEVAIKSVECTHPERIDSIFMQMVLIAETQDKDLVQRFGMRIKNRLGRLAETTTVVIKSES